MRLDHNQFYYRYGVRLLSQLAKPKPISNEYFYLPMDSIVHYASDDPESLNRDNLLLREVKRLVYVNSVTELTSTLYAPRVVDRQVNSKVLSFTKNHKEFKRLAEVSDVSKIDRYSPIVFNYSFLENKYEYRDTNVSNYYEWFNIQKTLWDKVAELTKHERTQYIQIELPADLPSIMALNSLSRNINPTINKLIPTEESFIVLEIWKWLSKETRESSALSSLTTGVDLNKVVLVLTSGNFFRLVNLKTLLSFNNEEDGPGKTAVSPDILKKLTLRFFHQFKDQTYFNEETGLETIEEEDGIDDIIGNIDEELSGKINLSEVNVIKGISASDKIEPPEQTIDSYLDYEVDQLPDNLATISNAKSVTDTYKDLLDSLADQGNLTVSEYKENIKLLEQLKNLPSPFDPNVSLLDYAKIEPSTLSINKEKSKIPSAKSVTDPSMLESSLQSFDSDYIKDVLNKDIAGAVLSLVKAGVMVLDYKIETVDNITGSYQTVTIKVKPISGKVATLRMKLPVLNDRGEFVTGNNKYRARKQRVDLPIRKVDSDKVSLTSYYGKIFVNRSEFKADNYRGWLVNQITQLSYNENPTVKNLVLANVFDNYQKTPKLYSQLAKDFKSFEIGDYTFFFKKKLLEEALGISVNEIDGYYPVGFTKSKELIFIGKNDEFYLKGSKLTELGTIESILSLDISKAPVEYANATVFSTAIPTGFILSYLLGFKELLKTLKVKPRVHVGKRLPELAEHEWYLSLSNAKLIFSKKDKLATMILYGLTYFEKALKKISLEAMDNKDVYLVLLESRNISTRYLRELEGQDKLFIDNITEEILREMKEPTTYRGLLIRACELLTTEDYPDENDMRYMRIRGYERFAGAVFKELNDSYRDFSARQIRNRNSMEMSPYATWSRITKDPTVMLVADINPIENLKQQEAVTMTGEGGRSKGAVGISVRGYHKNDLGVISEATVDSSDVSINTFLSANPGFTSLRGLTMDYDPSKSGTGLLSTTAVSAVGAVNDSGKRTVFHSIQNSHTISATGYRQAMVRTGYEAVIPHRVGDMYCVTAKKPGKVISVKNKGIIVQYTDGETKGFELGIRYGKSEGSMYPHELVTNLKEGDSFEIGEAICYNTGFFEVDMLDPKRVVWKTAGLVKTALFESQQTFEDSSSLSPRAAQMLTTFTVKTRSLVLGFDQAVSRMVKVGQSVDILDPLCIIQDEITANTGMLDDETIDALKRLSDRTPKAKYKGIVTKIEVFYHGDKNEMHPSLKTIADYSDSELKRLSKETMSKTYTGSVDSEYRVEGTPLALDTLEIKFYIKVGDIASSGDKAVFSNQLKTTIGEVFEYPIRTESGDEIDAIFGEKSLAARIVNSPFIIGTTTSLLKLIAKRAVELYKK